MTKAKIYSWLSAATSFIGVGMLLGHNLGDSTKNTALWLGGILVLLGGILFGMAIASNQKPEKQPPEAVAPEANAQPTDTDKSAT